jgi:Domain of unknown function (DUF1735)
MKKNITKLGAVIICVTLSACLNDDKYALDPSGTNNVLEFSDPSVPVSKSGSIYPAWARAFPVSAEGTFEQVISYSGPNGNDKNIELTLAVDPIALDEYNRQQEEGLFGEEPLKGTTYELLPDDHYDIESLSITIPKGSTKAVLKVTVYPNVFDLSKKYALPLRIVSASSGIISGNFSVGIFGVAVKNPFDAVYRASIWMTGWSAYGLYNSQVPVVYPNPGIALATTGPNTNQLSNLVYTSNLLPGLNPNGSSTQFGDASPVFTFDLNLTDVDTDGDEDTPPVKVHKILSVTNAITPFAPRFRQFVLNPAAAASDNWFNPADRSMNANFLLMQSGRPDMTNYWNLTFTGER